MNEKIQVNQFGLLTNLVIQDSLVQSVCTALQLQYIGNGQLSGLTPE